MANLIEENQKLKSDNQYLNERLKKIEDTFRRVVAEKDKEIKELKKNLELF
jgi:hypothetical protein